MPIQGAHDSVSRFILVIRPSAIENLIGIQQCHGIVGQILEWYMYVLLVRFDYEIYHFPLVLRTFWNSSWQPRKIIQ